ncbi:MAG: phosphoenolpyruvate--protein phosphotransferase [Bacillota bacterium]|nr:phosphoenolpyruvate--protein phosphotransferase [Bacillota bacterium]
MNREKLFRGTGVSQGIGSAPALKYEQTKISVPTHPSSDTDSEITAFTEACERVKDANRKLYDEALKKAGKSEADIFEAHITLLEDEDSLIDPIKSLIASGLNAANAAANQFDEIIAMMEAVEDEYMRQRAADFRDLKAQVLRSILGLAEVDISRLDKDVILIARDLAPSDTIRMDMNHIRGIVCEEGGKTSHTAILAKAMGLPAVVGCAGIVASAADGELMLIDGETGTVICSPSETKAKEYGEKAVKLKAEREALGVYLNKKTVTSDGHVVAISANIASPEECRTSVENGCEGVGLFRSEFLYMDRNTLPGEDEQFEAYKKALEYAAGRPVTIRTLDAGGDKGLSMLTLPHEDNPFLGYRAIRICLDQPEIFKTQLRALYRASVYGKLRIMFPMISSVEELRKAKRIVNEVKEELAAKEIAFAKDVEVGMMVEIPSVAVMADIFAKEVDFFSIGTNDLVQYTTAVDRGNDRIAHLYSHYHPAAVRLIAGTIKAAHDNGIHCCMCGEAAGDIGFIPALIGLGLDDFSMSAPGILRARKLISGLSYSECRKGALELLGAATTDEVRETLKGPQFC